SFVALAVNNGPEIRTFVPRLTISILTPQNACSILISTGVLDDGCSRRGLAGAATGGRRDRTGRDARAAAGATPGRQRRPAGALYGGVEVEARLRPARGGERRAAQAVRRGWFVRVRAVPARDRVCARPLPAEPADELLRPGGRRPQRLSHERGARRRCGERHRDAASHRARAHGRVMRNEKGEQR